MNDQVIPSQSEVETAVIESVSRSLNLKPADIQINCSLEEVYGAESLDMLEVIFTLEKTFRIRMPNVNILRSAEERFGEGIFVRQGILTEQGLNVLRHLRPEIDPALFTGTLRVHELGRLMTSQTFVRLVLRLLEAKDEAYRKLIETGCAKCGSHEIVQSSAAPEFVCSGCGAAVPVPSGDDVLIEDVMLVYNEGR